jgi:amidase
MIDELENADGIALGELVRKGQVTPLELVERAVCRIEAVNPRLNAVIHRMYDEARRAAETLKIKRTKSRSIPGPFTGVPFLLKDLIAEYAGAPFWEGCVGLKGHVSKLDTELVRRQKSAGLIVVGKTNTPEFGGLPTTDCTLFGPTANPWNPFLTPGGSSGGSASAAAARIVPMAHANDAGGSIRVPASCCGLFGLKPTRGRNPLGPLFGDLMGGLICEHAVTVTVRDSAALLDATCGTDAGDPYCAPARKRPYLHEVGKDVKGLKIGYLTSIPEGWHLEPDIHPDCRAAALDAAKLCESLGHHVYEIPADTLAWPGLYKKFGLLWACGIGHTIQYWEETLGKKLTQKDLEPMTWMSYQAGLKRTGADYLRTMEEVQRFSRKMGAFLSKRRCDLILSPTICQPPVERTAFKFMPGDPMRAARMSSAYLALTYVYNLTGQPAMSVPLFWNGDHLPIGVQFAGRFGDEGLLIRLASQLEQCRPWRDRRPPIRCGD